jgi:hypothetical protein
VHIYIFYNTGNEIASSGLLFKASFRENDVTYSTV